MAAPAPVSTPRRPTLHERMELLRPKTNVLTIEDVLKVDGVFTHEKMDHLEQAAIRFDKQMSAWKASKSRKEFLSLLERQRPPGGWQIKTAVILGSGSLLNRLSTRHLDRTFDQIVVFVDAVEHVQLTSDSKIEILAEEMYYADLDILLLASLGITARNRPEPEKHTDWSGSTDWPWASKSDLMSFDCGVPIFLDAPLRKLLEVNSRLRVGPQYSAAYTGIIVGGRWQSASKSSDLTPEFETYAAALLRKSWRDWNMTRGRRTFPDSGDLVDGLSSYWVYWKKMTDACSAIDDVGFNEEDEFKDVAEKRRENGMTEV